MIIKKDVEKVLKKIPDPEIGVSLWDLGLIYKIDIDKKGNVEILMTLRLDPRRRGEGEGSEKSRCEAHL